MNVELVFSEDPAECPIPGFDGYFATYEGEIISYKRGKREVKKVNLGKKGYCTVGLTPNGSTKQNRQRIHRMIALAWINNPNEYPQVNHKDGNKQNNCVKNLEWADAKQQILHAHKNGLISGKNKAVYQLDQEGTIIAEFKSITEASACTGATIGGISACCKGKQMTTLDFCWMYTKDFDKNGFEKIVEKLTLDGIFLEEYKNIKEAADANDIDIETIIYSCKNRQSKAGKWKWRYKKVENNTEKALYKETRKWVELERYPKYRISRDGRIYSDKSKIIMKPNWSGTAMSVGINEKEGKAKPVQVHRLVAYAYIPNPKNLPVVNHLDSDPSNNNVENLEWASHSRNTQHATDAGLMKNRRAIVQMDLDGNFLARFDSGNEAAREIKGDARAINNAVRGKSKYSYGYRWKYE